MVLTILHLGNFLDASLGIAEILGRSWLQVLQRCTIICAAGVSQSGSQLRVHHIDIRLRQLPGQLMSDQASQPCKPTQTQHLMQIAALCRLKR